ncbi:MAG: hypothetical protein CMN84_05540 [Spongiibacteraceae bacterium]|jgi:hypothetical protein|nr:hypothetical protein [Spongiibacteraceae bacterium]|tara:strand:+ start:85 stop:480 length:396 start_codon:yes stop_codon:yes gene_type:complete
MSIGNWTPTNPDAEIDSALLETGLTASRKGKLEELTQILSLDQQTDLASQLRLPKETWLIALEHYNSEQLKALLRFFVRAEMLIPGCEVGDQSPAIWANKLLGQRGDRLTKEDLLWIRENTNNRFIPNGSI